MTSTARTLLCAITFLAFSRQYPAFAQTQSQAVVQDPGVMVSASETPTQKLTRAWDLLSSSATDTRHSENRVLALVALSGLHKNPRASELVRAAMKDPDLDVRTSAVLAAGRVGSPSLAPGLHDLLNDPEPQVAFTAATTLWSDFKDRTGEDILAAVAEGDRKATPGLFHGAQHSMSKTLHSPAALAKLGAQTGAGLLLGPFGFSVAAVEYMRNNGSDAYRVQAIDLLSEQKTEAARRAMINALDDKDPGVRAAAVKALGDFRQRSYASTVAPLLDDSKLPVRLTAAAAYINCTAGSAAPSKRR